MIDWQYALSDPDMAAAIASPHKDRRATCPFCASGRRKQYDKTLSVRFDGAKIIYNCWHCGEGSMIAPEERAPVRRTLVPIPPPPPLPPAKIEPKTTLEQSHVEWFSSVRKLDLETLMAFDIFSDTKWIGSAQATVPVIGFPYRNADGVYAIKYRSVPGKGFSQAGAASTLFNLDRVPEDAEAILIAEGEIDCMTAWQCGFHAATSIPGGALLKPMASGVEVGGGKLGFVFRAKAQLDKAKKVLIAMDADEPGEVTAEELSRRIGKAKCWRVTYPEGCKDLNDTLVKWGPEAVTACIANAKPWPVVGLYSPSNYREQIESLYRDGMGRGMSTGWRNVDELFTIAPGQLTVITGVPNSGKSAWLDALLVNLSLRDGVRAVVCSFENPPHYHAVKLAELYTGRPFFDGPTERIDPTQLAGAMAWLEDRIMFMEQKDGDATTIDWVLERARDAVQRLGARVLVIDPYNMLQRDGDSETDFVSDMLTKVRTFARAFEVHVFFVAHPAKLQRADGKHVIPTGYDISGSAHWFNKSDNGLTVHRNQENSTVDIIVWKCRWKWIGRQGTASLIYDVVNGRYSEPPLPDMPIGGNYQ